MSKYSNFFRALPTLDIFRYFYLCFQFWCQRWKAGFRLPWETVAKRMCTLVLSTIFCSHTSFLIETNSNSYGVVSPRRLDFQVSDDEWARLCAYWVRGYLFGDTWMQSLCSLLDWVACFVFVELFYALAPQVQAGSSFVHYAIPGLCYFLHYWWVPLMSQIPWFWCSPLCVFLILLPLSLAWYSRFHR